MKCVILQPSYIPWRGYFHQIYKADKFVFYDDVQYDKRGWRNRNRIKTSTGLQWLTIPVHSKGTQAIKTPINKIPIMWEQNWQKDHVKTLQHAYSKAPYFNQYFEDLEEAFEYRPLLLADFTIKLTRLIANWLGIKNTDFIRSSSLNIMGEKTERIIKILELLGADHYITGPAAKDYIDEAQFRKKNIELEYMQYDYPVYPQLHAPFKPNVSILDLLFMTGDNALQYIVTEAK